ncbi:helix-turn-helix domain-containing protein [Brucella pseudogrignonensis]|uniref:Y4mF family transcriptional regulator n=1 Tax=Brucella pseudogrignonensis TaxID=419475 RepID=A0ABU1MDP8_9HYPH|nr:helix-turn-helix domain-containing protein [Brucella pseudogrignonensis]MDR6434170.1 y4mF family transcriptional regulator [Brucella pseudogrignonensis]
MLKSAADLGALVREKRKALGWTQTDLAGRCGTGDRFIIDLEKGKATCQLGKALVVAREVGINIIDANSLTVNRQTLPEDNDELSFVPKY